MSNQNRKNKVLSLLAGIGLLGSMPVASSVPAKQIIQSVSIQKTTPVSIIKQVKVISGFMWSS